MKRRKRREDSRITGLTSFVVTGSRLIERYQTPEIQGAVLEREKERERERERERKRKIPYYHF